MKHIALLCFWLCLSLGALADQKKVAPTFDIHPGLVFQVDGFEVKRAENACENWNWAAALQSILAFRDVPTKQSDWIDKVDGGACIIDERPINPELIAKAVTQDTVREDGRRQRITARLLPIPLNAEQLLDNLRQQHPLILFLDRHALVLAAAQFDELIYSNGTRRFPIRELRCIDPATGEGLILTEKEAARITAALDIEVEAPRLLGK